MDSDVAVDFIDYLSSDPYLPQAPGIDSSYLRILSTFQSEELFSRTGLPGGEEIVEAASDGTIGSPTDADYRWAIEAGNVSVFIPSRYTDVDNFTTRQLFSSPLDPKTYQSRGTNREGTATTYPALGRVWEICAEENSGFPVLVWEERTCSSGGGGGGDDDSDRDDRSDALDTDASGTLSAAQLAATGSMAGGLSLGLAGVALALIGGLLYSRRGERQSG